MLDAQRPDKPPAMNLAVEHDHDEPETQDRADDTEQRPEHAGEGREPRRRDHRDLPQIWAQILGSYSCADPYLEQRFAVVYPFLGEVFIAWNKAPRSPSTSSESFARTPQTGVECWAEETC